MVDVALLEVVKHLDTRAGDVAALNVLDVQQPVAIGDVARHGHVHEERQGRSDFAGADDVAVANELDVAVTVEPDLPNVVGGVVA